MPGLLMRLFGHKMFHKAVAPHTSNGGVLDIHLGFAMLRDRRVPIGSKLLALALGAGGIALLINLQLPLEAVLAILLPVIGFMGDAVVDGIEGVVGPFVLAALLLPHLAPAAVAQTIRAERAAALLPMGVTS